MIDARNDKDQFVRIQAAAALVRVSPQNTKASIAMLLDALLTGDELSRRHASEALADLGSSADEAVETLISALKKDNEDVRCEAAFALVKIRPSSATLVVNALINDLHDQPNYVRAKVNLTFERIGRLVVGPLATALKHREPRVRDNAAFALFKMSGKAEAAVPAPIDTLKDDDRDVRSTAARALGGIGSAAKGAVPALIGLLGDDADYFVVWALGRIGPDAKAAVPALTRLLVKTTSDVTRKETLESLESIDPEAAKQAADVLTKAKAKESAQYARTLGKEILEGLRHADFLKSHQGAKPDVAESKPRIGFKVYHLLFDSYGFLDDKLVFKGLTIPRNEETYRRENAAVLEKLGVADRDVLTEEQKRDGVILYRVWKFQDLDLLVTYLVQKRGREYLQIVQAGSIKGLDEIERRSNK